MRDGFSLIFTMKRLGASELEVANVTIAFRIDWLKTLQDERLQKVEINFADVLSLDLPEHMQDLTHLHGPGCALLFPSDPAGTVALTPPCILGHTSDAGHGLLFTD
jgi:hypothetical protein